MALKAIDLPQLQHWNLKCKYRQMVLQMPKEPGQMHKLPIQNRI